MVDFIKLNIFPEAANARPYSDQVAQHFVAESKLWSDAKTKQGNRVVYRRIPDEVLPHLSWIIGIFSKWGCIAILQNNHPQLERVLFVRGNPDQIRSNQTALEQHLRREEKRIAMPRTALHAPGLA